MSDRGWPAIGRRHGRHRRDWVNSAWTPVVLPTETDHLPAHARPDWVPRPATDGPTRAGAASRHEAAADPDAAEFAVAQGLRSFDLGSVPASVTTPRAWRRAAWFAIGTSAAVLCGLAVAAVRLVGSPPADAIDALPAFPTQRLGTLPTDETARATETAQARTSQRTDGSRRDTVVRPDGSAEPSAHPAVPSSTTEQAPPPPPGTTAESTPSRTTVSPEAVTPADPDAMGDRTERYFTLVTEDPQAAHDMCTGGMAWEGQEGIEKRYAGVDHVEVEDITIDRDQSVTTSTLRIVRDDGTVTVVQRRLTFTWGSNPKISEDTAT